MNLKKATQKFNNINVKIDFNRCSIFKILYLKRGIKTMMYCRK